MYSQLRGIALSSQRYVHKMYGPVVRTAPNELSYTDPSVWKTLCGHQPFPKNFMFYSASVNGERSINTAGKEQHARLRKAFAPSFSEKAIQTQKDIIERYINLLMQRLEEEARKSSENPVDIVNYLNWTTFDIIGDLAFGEPFGCLENSQYHFWVKNLFLGFKAITFLNVARNIIPFESLIYLLLPKSLVQKTIQNFDLTVEKVDRRLSSDVERPDFMSNIRTLDGKDKITKPETYSTTGFLVVAGSETTASLLSAVTYYLYMNPEVREKAVQELHQAYTSGKEINLLSVGKLRYLSAVLEEALRLYPPVPEGLPRVVPAGGREICHRWVPEGVSGSIFLT